MQFWIRLDLSLTSFKAGDLLCVRVPGDADAVFAHVVGHGGEGEELPTAVVVHGVDSQEPQVAAEVPQFGGEADVGSVNLPGVDEGSEGVHLLTHGTASKQVARVPRAARRCRAGEGHALVLRVLLQAMIVDWEL